MYFLFYSDLFLGVTNYFGFYYGASTFLTRLLANAANQIIKTCQEISDTSENCIGHKVIKKKIEYTIDLVQECDFDNIINPMHEIHIPNKVNIITTIVHSCLQPNLEKKKSLNLTNLNRKLTK